MKPLNLIALLLFIAGAIWALTLSDHSVREVQRAYFRAISPFLKSGSAIEAKTRDFLNETRHSKELEAELEVTRQHLERLRLIESRFRMLEQENIQLRQALDFKASTRFDVVAARVIRRNPSTWWQTIEIDAGSGRGLHPQLAVVCNEGLVGKTDLVDMGGERSSVLLLTDEKCQVSARVEGSPEVGILSGRRGSFEGTPDLRLRFLSANAAVHPGQRVFTSGRGGIFQADILIGTIESVESGALDSEALVRPTVDFTDLDSVFVILSKDS
jgi:rod shape-determining protein MreC